MQAFQHWLASSPLATCLKSFIAIIIGAAVADWATDGVISLTNWETWVISALVSVTPTLINFLNPADSRYGVGSTTAE